MIAAAHSSLWSLEPTLPTGNIAWNWTSIHPADTVELASWMHPWELARLSILSSPARRASFLAGRWAAKQLLAAVALLAVPALDLRHLAVLSWDRRGRGTPPSAWWNGRRLAGHLAIAHDSQRAIVAWSAASQPPVGIDVLPHHAKLSPTSPVFTHSEQQQLQQAHNGCQATAAHWFAAKEAAFKASAHGVFRPGTFRVITAPSLGTAGNPGNVGTVQHLPHSHVPDSLPVNYACTLQPIHLAGPCTVAIACRDHSAIIEPTPPTNCSFIPTRNAS